MEIQKLIQVIDLVYEAVDKSKVGPMMSKDEKGEMAYRILAMNLFLNLCAQICPKGPISADFTMKEPGDDWKK